MGEPPDGADQSDRGGKPHGRGTPQPQLKPWQRLGYASHVAMVNEIALANARGSGARYVEQWAEDHLGKLTMEMVPVKVDRPQRKRVTRQVNVKLGEEDFQNLRRAAKHFRIAPGTLGRIILSRAARDIISREEAGPADG